jgi:hypothetical protein
MGNKNMELLEYKKIIEKFPAPTIEQTQNFIDFVANDHSWYKQLPEGRLEPFYFYLDPNAGKLLEKIEKKDFLKKEKHYWIKKEATLNAYQNQYGTWQYYTNNYTVNYIPNSDNSIRDSRPIIGLNIINIKGEAEKIPEEVIYHGKFMMSKYLHRRAFAEAHNYYDENGISYAENHKIIIAELKKHLCSFINFIYN